MRIHLSLLLILFFSNQVHGQDYQKAIDQYNEAYKQKAVFVSLQKITETETLVDIHRELLSLPAEMLEEVISMLDILRSKHAILVDTTLHPRERWQECKSAHDTLELIRMTPGTTKKSVISHYKIRCSLPNKRTIFLYADRNMDLVRIMQSPFSPLLMEHPYRELNLAIQEYNSLLRTFRKDFVTLNNTLALWKQHLNENQEQEREKALAEVQARVSTMDTQPLLNQSVKCLAKAGMDNFDPSETGSLEVVTAGTINNNFGQLKDNAENTLHNIEVASKLLAQGKRENLSQQQKNNLRKNISTVVEGIKPWVEHFNEALTETTDKYMLALPFTAGSYGLATAYFNINGDTIDHIIVVKDGKESRIEGSDELRRIIDIYKTLQLRYYELEQLARKL